MRLVEFIKRKFKKKITYTFINHTMPITKADLDKYNNLSMFFVFKSGKVLPLISESRNSLEKYLLHGQYMYKEDLEKLIFSDDSNNSVS